MSADATIARTIADYLRERLALVRWFRMNASVKHTASRWTNRRSQVRRSRNA